MRTLAYSCTTWTKRLVTILFLAPACVGAAAEPWRLSPAPGSPMSGLPKVNALGIADLNGDGRPDLAAVNGDPGELLIQFSQGGGRFAPPERARIAIGATASGLAIGNVIHATAAPEIIVCFHDRDEVAIVAAGPQGIVDPPRMQRICARSQGSPHVHNLAIGDINHDGHIDVLVAQADDNAIAWALGDGAGGFVPAAQTVAAGRHPYTIVVADFDNDGDLDLASPNSESDDLTVGLGDGAGRFTAPPGPRARIPSRTLMLAAGDMNGDARVDLVSNSDADQRTLTLLIGDGRGGFTTSAHSFRAAARCYGQIVADLNGDGGNDLVAPCIDRASVVVWLAEDAAALRFQRMEFATPGTDSQVIAVGDVNDDGILDVVAAGWARPTMTVLLGAKETVGQ